MIPNESSPIYHTAKYILLEDGDTISSNDQYYNQFQDQWLPVQKEFIENEFFHDESKPIRKRNANYHQPEPEPKYYIVYAPDYDEGNTSILELTDEEFMNEAEKQGHVYSHDGFQASWNDDTLPCIDSYLRKI